MLNLPHLAARVFGTPLMIGRAMVLEGIVVVTASGDLVLKVASEVASSGITIKAGTLLDLRKIA